MGLKTLPELKKFQNNLGQQRSTCPRFRTLTLSISQSIFTSAGCSREKSDLKFNLRNELGNFN